MNKKLCKIEFIFARSFSNLNHFFFFYAYMVDSAQKERLENYIKDIFEACKNDPLRTEVAITNLKALNNAIIEYEKAPKYYNAIIEIESQSNHVSSKKSAFESEYKCPVVGELEKIYAK